MTEDASLVVDVSLMSGKTVSVKTRLDEYVGMLKRRAQTALSVFKGRLLDSSGRLLDARQSVQEAELRNDTADSANRQGASMQDLEWIRFRCWSLRSCLR